ncbi:hypothetical protein [uncultured Chryseobacterium sp.]|uniref:hypothetical protein n=1 Tax=uncultured Chryseobacterium sp. TaxID=259322 RepID=UPI0025FF2932|nr:hypothetical protein [uncultured Chryseobacterium sp.]
MKNYIFLLCILLFLSSCKSHIQSQKKNNLYQNIVEAYIEYRNSEGELDKKENILIFGANESENTKNAYWVDIAFVNPRLLSDFQYKKVYEIKGYKLIIDESLNKSNELKNSFHEVEYENFNLAKESIDYNLKNWHITFNSKQEIIRISPQQKSKEIRDLMVKKGAKFSQDFDDL